MIYVTDTHPLLYFFDRPKKLGSKARPIFDGSKDGRSAIYVPAAVLWEVSILIDRNRISLGMPFSQWCENLLAFPGFNFLALELEDLKIFHNLRFHKDPFDRQVVAAALRLDAPLLTNDSMMHKHKPCQLVWD